MTCSCWTVPLVGAWSVQIHPAACLGERLGGRADPRLGKIAHGIAADLGIRSGGAARERAYLRTK